MTSRGLAPGPPDDRATTVDDPPERWFYGNGRDLKYVAQLRLAHARTNPRAIPGVAEPTTQSYGWAKHRRHPEHMGTWAETGETLAQDTDSDFHSHLPQP